MTEHLSKQILKLMCDGVERKASDLTALTGRPHKQVKHAVHNGRRRGYYVAVNDHYVITEVGRAWAAHEPLSTEEIARRNYARLKAARALARASRPPKPPRAPKRIVEQVSQEAIVESAMKSRPALDMAWMSVAREQEASHASA